jgi:hypothetical protein
MNWKGHEMKQCWPTFTVLSLNVPEENHKETSVMAASYLQAEI